MSRKHNLLFILTDQQRADTLACYGNDFVLAPNLNRLAIESVVFENAYVTQPVCAPSRSSIRTGLYPHTTGCTDNHVPLRPETPTLAEMVSSDYARAHVGKWHLGDEVIAQYGFETWVAIDDRLRKYYTRHDYLSQFSSYHQYLVSNGLEPDEEVEGTRVFGLMQTAALREEFSKARFVGREAARFLRQAGSQPFVLYASLFEPHPPFRGPLDDLYSPDEIPVGPRFHQPPPTTAGLVNRVMAESWADGTELYGVDMTTEAGWRTIRARYLGLVTLVDRAVGDILQALDRTGLADNTIVVLTSDHGEMVGDHGLYQKGILYQESIKAPLLIRVLWLGAGPQRVSGPISQIDLVPTLLDLLGEPIPRHLQGQTRVFSVPDGEGNLADNDAVVEWNGDGGRRPSKWLMFGQGPPDLPWERVVGPWRSLVLADGFKLNLSPVDRCELYDLNPDPWEQQNIFDDPQQRDRFRNLTARLRRWQKLAGDDAPLPDGWHDRGAEE